MTLTFGIDVGGTKIATAVLNQHGTVIEESVVPTAGQGTAVVAQIWNLIDDASSRHTLHGVGIAVPGNVDPKTSTVIAAANIGWNHVDLEALVEPALRGSARVVIVNDANAAAWAEYRFGNHDPGDSFAMITVGTGIGGGFILNGRLLEGATGAGGEVGHLTLVEGGEVCSCGSRGCWERYASGSALHRSAARTGWGPEGASRIVLERAGEQNEATELVQAVVDHLIRGLCLVSSALDPSIIVLGGGLGSDPKFHAMVGESLASTVIPSPRAKPRLGIAKLGAVAGAVGAADLAVNKRSA
ncbi:ROK family protein [Arthrobacter sp. RAF14]|uniref:ROK family protein n=1 Tax=Arthrobacter sp. RAF14 TaxID=3233051 RepID=UPI003F93CB6C